MKLISCLFSCLFTGWWNPQLINWQIGSFDADVTFSFEGTQKGLVRKWVPQFFWLEACSWCWDFTARSRNFSSWPKSSSTWYTKCYQYCPDCQCLHRMPHINKGVLMALTRIIISIQCLFDGWLAHNLSVCAMKVIVYIKTSDFISAAIAWNSSSLR